MSRETKLAKNTFILAIGTFLPKLASFITLPILTGSLTKEEMGSYDIITVLVSLLLPTVTLQVSAAAFRFLIDVRNDQEKIKTIINTIYTFITPVSVISVIILFFVFPGQSTLVKLMICLYYLADIFVNATRQIVRGIGRNLDYSISAIVSALGKMIFAVVFVWYFKIGILGAVTALFGASTVSLIVIMLRSKIYHYFSAESISKECLKNLLAYSWPLIPNSMCMWVMNLSDRLIVTGILGVGVNAVYAIANKFPSLLTLAQTTFTMAWQENASMVSKDDDADKYYSSMFRTMFDLIAGFFGVLIAVTPLLFILLIKGDYDDAYNHIPILFMGMFFYSLSAFLGGIYSAYKKTLSVGVTTMIAAILNLVINLALINRIGLYAASVSTLASHLFLFVYRIIDVRKLVKIKFSVRHLVIVLLLITMECFLCFQRAFLLDIANFIISTAAFFLLNHSFVKSVWKKMKSLLAKRRSK